MRLRFLFSVFCAAISCVQNYASAYVVNLENTSSIPLLHNVGSLQNFFSVCKINENKWQQKEHLLSLACDLEDEDEITDRRMLPISTGEIAGHRMFFTDKKENLWVAGEPCFILLSPSHLLRVLRI